ncbi:unnamed protein product [Darwinula stevensoni]|uniref:Kazal-like domain-containing protein n=1 Tax=Darwinula stevensoni TaxID=69355 RepID=A0A7R9AH58_9CRUS|nr:unnamed protein product [Darwinula stevensoni]CAG0904960.1 unnamed protein product [Darwinula stevensoni]
MSQRLSGIARPDLRIRREYVFQQLRDESGELQNGAEVEGRCEKGCTLEYRPVCGSDFQTYPNICAFQVAQCKNPRLRLRHHGKC